MQQDASELCRTEIVACRLQLGAAADTALHKMADRIQARASRRVGELLKEVERNEKGGRNRLNAANSQNSLQSEVLSVVIGMRGLIDKRLP